MNGHILILGDSVFDNTVYLGIDELDGQAHLKQALPNYHHTFLALDGAVTDGIPTQLKYVEDAIKQNGPVTDLVMSIGGNNLLANAFILNLPAKDVMSGLSMFREVQEKFDKNYMKMMDEINYQFHINNNVIALKPENYHVFGIYYPCFRADQGDPKRQFPTDKQFVNSSRLGVDMFNHVIRENLDPKSFIDLNNLFCFGEDKNFYANPIEPSSFGSEVIANAIRMRIKERA